MSTQSHNDLFAKLGVEIGEGKLHIDLNQTRDFFHVLKEIFQQKAEEIQKDISEGKVDISEKVGIKIDHESINIDFNQTKDFVESFGKKLEGFLAEVEKSVKEIEKKKE